MGNWASEPLPLKEAKRAAVAMLRERGKVEPRDWIADLNKIAATEIDRVALAKKRKQWPRDLVGGGSHPGSMQVSFLCIDTRKTDMSSQTIARVETIYSCCSVSRRLLQLAATKR